MRDAKLELEKFIYMLIPKIVIGLIAVVIIFPFYIYFSALYEKRTVKLDAILDSQMNVVVFSPELEEDDYIWEFILGVFKNGEYLHEYDVNIYCQYQEWDKFKEECIKKSIEQQPKNKEKVILAGQNTVIIPRALLDKGTFSVAVRTGKYERESSVLWFCFANGELVVKNSLTETNSRFTELCSSNFDKSE